MLQQKTLKPGAQPCFDLAPTGALCYRLFPKLLIIRSLGNPKKSRMA